MKIYSLLVLLFLSSQLYSQCDPNMIFANDTSNAVCIELGTKVRSMYSNNLPNHPYGTWPSGNPVSPQELSHFVCAFPQKAATPLSIYDGGDINRCSQYIEFGLGVNGIRMAPFGARWFVNPNTQEENTDWNVEALEMFNMDFNNSHSNGGGQYHYHGIPIVYFTDSLGIDGTVHSPLIGYAADGFPIYYKYLYNDPNDANSAISAFSSGHSLKPGNRPGDGITAPDGPYNGFYVEDYEFLDPNWELDECNGRFGKTPEYPDGTYYYVMTDNWPYIPRCFYGTVVDNTFRIGMNCPPSNAEMDCSEEVINSAIILDQSNIVIAPNPASSVLQILLDDPLLSAKISQISIYDLNGKVWFSQSIFVQELHVSHIPAGTYFLQIDTEDSQITQKIMLQR